MKLSFSIPSLLIGSNATAIELIEPFDGANIIPVPADVPRRLTKSSKIPKCDPTTVNLADYPQWVAETGYWIGEYTFLQGDGTPFSSTSWPYPYDSYKGFITGNIKGNAYRQRNVFLYPPQKQEICDSYGENDLKVVGNGTCGINGNTKIFFADQNATTCDNGNIEGLYAGLYPTTTQLIGTNALLYQVLFNGALIQSQLTTITSDTSGQTYRTRTAQGFNFMTQLSNSCSYYRERKVTKEEFYNEFHVAVQNITAFSKGELCKTDPSDGSEQGGMDKCINHLESSFSL